jgi:hypothetical protein
VVTEESSQLERAQQEYQTSTDNTEAENNLKVPITRSEQKIPSASLPLDSPLYINDLKRCIIFCPNFPTSPNFPTFLNNRFNLLIE